MTITPQQREQRRKYLGSSDAAAVLGLSPWRSPHDVWVSKMHELAEDKSDAARIGDWLEPVLVQRAVDMLYDGHQLVFDSEAVIAPNGVMAAHLDGALWKAADTATIPIEAKYRSTRSIPPDSGVKSLRDLWGDATGEDDFDAIPLDERCQIMHQMICCGADVGYVAVALCEFELDFRLYRVIREGHEQWFEKFERALCDWWARHIGNGEEPSRERASYDVLRRVVRHDPLVPCTLPDGLFEAELTAAWKEKAAKDERKQARTALLAAMGDANFAQGNGYRASFTRDGKLIVREDANVGIS